MKLFLCLTFFIFTALVSEAQNLVVFKLGKSPLKHINDSVFLAGSFNNWNPGSHSYKFSNSKENNFDISIVLPSGIYEYKTTRGDWNRVECSFEGKDIENRYLSISSDTSIIIDIEAWKDDFPQATRKHSATKQVQLLDTLFFIPQLNRNRKIWIYLPEGYANSKKKYPVMYMHDGQNVFDDATSDFGEWGVDECLDSLIKTGKTACIVIGIENGPQRMNEYNPFEFRNFGKGEADLYLDFIVDILKPFIDNKYRTLSNNENTIITGSSMGGLVSYYAMLRNPEVFGKAGIFSPAFWTAPEIMNFTDSLAYNVDGKFFFYGGGKEGDDFINDMEEIAEQLGKKSSSMIYSVIDPAGLHNEKAWRKWFAEFYIWIMASGYNTVIKVND